MKKVIILILLLCFLYGNIGYSQQKPYRILNSFSAGELSELLNAREDLSKYHSGCSLMENMIPLLQGGAQKRPGTIYVAESKNNTKIRLIPFEFSTTQSYVIELGNQYLRLFTSAARVTTSTGTADHSALNNRLSHWKMDDNTTTTAVVDTEGNHDGVATTNTEVLHARGKVGDGCFNFDRKYAFDVADDANFTFVEGVDGTFSIIAWIYVNTEAGDKQYIATKWDSAGVREWAFDLDTAFKPELWIYDETNNKAAYSVANTALTLGWHFICVTYDGEHGSWSGATAANYIILYVDGAAVAATDTNDAAYVKMIDTATNVVIGGKYLTSTVKDGFAFNRVDNVAIFTDVLSAAEILAMYTASVTYELTTPYLTADLFELKFVQSADVLYITHPDYEPRKLSRFANDDWTFEAIGIDSGPFRDLNTDTSATISVAEIGGGGIAKGASVALTAVNCAPFIDGVTAGHEPGGGLATSKSQIGGLFKLVHPVDTVEFSAALTEDYAANTAENVSWLDCGTLAEGATWTLLTDNTWYGTVEVQRNYTIGAAHDASGWETVMQFESGAEKTTSSPRNVDTTGTEDYDDADYRVIFTDEPQEGTLDAYWGSDQYENIGIVKITAVTDSDTAIGTVVETLVSSDATALAATHKWAESAWSNYRGWPATVAFFEDRLCFGGNTGQPDTIWGSVTADYENMKEGADDDDAINFTLSARQVNVIQWLVGKDKLLIGTSGSEWTLAGSADEPLTPSNVKAEQQSTYGSAGLQATLANESVLFFQRGAKKMRELAYNWELDSYVAPDMTILSPEIAGDGITDTALQKTPDSALWCVKENGDLAVFVYERKEQITSWSRLITDDDFESVTVIAGDPEDEVWVSVERTIDGNTVRYLEYFSDRDFGTDVCDAFFVDSGITYDSTTTTTITGLDHLEGETVTVLGDGTVLSNETVSGGQITIDSSCFTVQAGLPYTVQVKTMPLSWVASGMTIQGRIKRINEVIARYYDSGDFYVGRDATDKELLSINGMETSEQRKTFPAGYDRPGYVFIYQQSPEPLTLLALMIEFMIY